MPIHAPAGFLHVSAVISDTALLLSDITGIEVADVMAADAVTFSVDSNSVRYTYDGTTPTASLGHLLGANVYRTEGGNRIRKIRFIRATGSDATIQITLENMSGVRPT